MMKKATFLLSIVFLTTTLSAQFEGNIKLGSSINSSINFGGKAGFYVQGAFGYRFYNNKRITIIPSFFIDKSAYTMDDLTFGALINSNGNFYYETSTLSYRLYGLGLNVNSEIKLLNVEKKINFYISPNLGYRRVFHIYQESSNPKIDVSEHPDINQGFIIDWGVELGVKFQRFKVGISLRDILNKSNKNHSSFIITNAFGFSVSYLFDHKKVEDKEE